MFSNQLKEKGPQPGRKRQLKHMATIDLGSLNMEFEDQQMMNRCRAQEEPYPSVKIVQKKEYWYKTSPNENRKKTNVQVLRKSQSMDSENHSEGHNVESKIFKLPSENDIQDFPPIKTFDSRHIDVSDIYIKVPIQT